ncbi:MAG: alpha/beta fold hydrolase, partial [Woeseiaceae bacterium]
MSPGGEYRARRVRRASRHAIRGVDCHVSEWGGRDDPLLVMLHGWGDAGSTFQFVVDELQDDWFVVAPDWRGFGESGHRAECYWFPDYLADLDRLLDLYRPQQPVRLVGHSMGANVAALYAGIRPERVAALVNVEGFGLADSDPADAPNHYRRWLDRSREEQGFAGYGSFDELLPRILKGSPRLTRERALFVARQWARESDGRVLIKADPAHRLPNAVQY